MKTNSVARSKSGVTALILAAGSGKRFGVDKRSIFLESGNMLLLQSISQFKEIGVKVLVCLSAGSKDDSMASMLTESGVDCVRCSRSVEGMGGTLAEGVLALGDASGVLVALADMPGLLPLTLSRLLENADSERIVYPVYQNRRGHPVFFGRRFLPELKALSGDSGASKVVQKNADSCIAVDVADPGVVLDVDTPDDLRRMDQLFQERSSPGESG